MTSTTLPVEPGTVVDFQSSPQPLPAVALDTVLAPASSPAFAEPANRCSSVEPLVTTGHSDISVAVATGSVVLDVVESPGHVAPAVNSPKPAKAERRSSTADIARKPLTRRTCSLMGVKIVGSGSYVPDNIVTNANLRERYGFDPDWIEQRTGIFARRHAPRDLATSDLCVEAARRAIDNAQVTPADIDLLVVGTFTPDHVCPSTACLVQERLGLDVPAFDVSAACSGFVYSLATASQFVATGNSKLALVIGGDTCSRIVNPLDKKIAPLFGDGAGAVLVTRGTSEQGLLCYQLGADGSGGSLLECATSGTRHPVTVDDVTAGRQFLNMDGRNVFIWAVRVVEDTIRLVLEKSNLRLEDVSLFVLHQANARILDHAVEKLGIPREKVLMQVDRYGNTSAGSIPLALDEAHRAGRVHAGDTIVMCGFGGGLTWGTAVFRW